MASAVLIGRGCRVYLVRDPPYPVVGLPLRGSDAEVARQLRGADELWVDPPGDPDVLGDRSQTIATETPPLLRLASRWGCPGRIATIAEVRDAWPRLPPAPAPECREIALASARQALAEAMRDPTEVLLALAREEERLERLLGRERNAVAEVTGSDAPHLEAYVRAAERFGAQFERHHGELEARLESATRELAPILSELTGPKAAARLIARAGGLAGLARMSASRLQLLGTRRRPSHDRGPRYGVLYRAYRMEDLPLARRGAYARSLAALAVIAARLDAAHAPLDRAIPLVARRDRRLGALQRSRR